MKTAVDPDEHAKRPRDVGEPLSRRQFLASGLSVGAISPALAQPQNAGENRGYLPTSLASGGSTPDLAERFRDLKRRFVFEYYPWYGSDPWRHWNNRGRRPPSDIAASSIPFLGPYDSRDPRVIERHARWIVESGVGSVALSWWGIGSYSDRLVHRVMDIMHDYDIKVTFGLEPYADDRAEHYVDDLEYILREYGERRGWDAFLLLKPESGQEQPIFKSFRTILPERVRDCHGVWEPVSDFTHDATWRRQTDRFRELVRRDFDGVTLLADSLDMGRTRDSGFDGIGIYDNYVRPEQYATWAFYASRVGLVFSFNINPGYDEIMERDPDPTGCTRPRPFEPETPELSFAHLSGRRLAQARSSGRIRTSTKATIRAQTDPALTNHRRQFFLVYINSFNEWHEGHAFEPMRDYGNLSPTEKSLSYHNVLDGRFRLDVLSETLRPIFEGSSDSSVERIRA